MTRDLSAFVASLDTTPPLEWTYDLSSLRALDPAERSQAEELLMQRAEQQHDARAVHTLVALGCDHLADRIAPLAARNGPIGYAARRALLGLRGEVEPVARDREHGPMIERFAAVVALSQERTDDAREALLDALADADPLVRSRAFDGLVEHYQLGAVRRDAAGRKELRAPLNRLDRLLSAELEALSRPAADELRFIFRSLSRGVDAVALGLTYQAGAVDVAPLVRAWITGATAELPVDALVNASAQDRAYVEAMVAVQLQPPLFQVRAPAALVQLGAKWSVPALSEARALAPPGSPFSAACDEALTALAAP